MENYTQLRVLGKGSFGAAWLIQRNSDRVQFVAKEIRLAGLKPSERESANNEIAVLRTLDHPNIIKYIDHFEYRGSLFIVMEYANGGDLYIKIKEREGQLFSEKELLRYFSQICLALGYMHERRILHRDLKTQNVFLTKDGIVKLGDFGISTVLRNTYELKRTVCGTPYYFSPELCLSKPYNNKSDVWALGCVLYEMTTLNHAFDGNNMKSLVQKILKGVYPPINPSYSSNLSKLISAMLQIDPHRRPNVTQIIDLPFVREALSDLQREVQSAREKRQSVVSDEEKARMQAEAAQRKRDYARKEQENAAKLAAAHQQQHAFLEQRQQKLMELQRQQEAQLEARKRELENRVKEQRKLQEQRKAKASAAANQKRDGESSTQEKAKPEAAAQPPQPATPAQPTQPAQASQPPPTPTPAAAKPQQSVAPPQAARAAPSGGAKDAAGSQSEATEAYRERQRQAAANKQKVQVDLGLQPPAGQARAAPARSARRKSTCEPINLPPDQPPPPRAPPSPHHYSSRKLTQDELGDALAAAYWQMRREAQRNKRHAADGESSAGTSTSGEKVGTDAARDGAKAPQAAAGAGAAAAAPLTAADTAGTDAANPMDADGEEGFRAFINGDAVMEAKPKEVEHRQQDYGALDTVITHALTVHSKKDDGDFDDEAFQDEPDATKFMLDGKTFQLPNVTADDPLMHRVESLRMFLEDKMGDEELMKCYNIMNSISTDDDGSVQKIAEVLPEDKRRYIPLVMQLVVCEDAFNRQGGMSK